jgi:ABC-type sulfate/molybdate transport systems ATPase subunit
VIVAQRGVRARYLATVICTLDEPGLAALFERTVVLSQGQIVADGASAESETAPARAATG